MRLFLIKLKAKGAKWRKVHYRRTQRGCDFSSVTRKSARRYFQKWSKNMSKHARALLKPRHHRKSSNGFISGTVNRGRFAFGYKRIFICAWMRQTHFYSDSTETSWTHQSRLSTVPVITDTVFVWNTPLIELRCEDTLAGCLIPRCQLSLAHSSPFSGRLPRCSTRVCCWAAAEARAQQQFCPLDFGSAPTCNGFFLCLRHTLPPSFVKIRPLFFRYPADERAEPKTQPPWLRQLLKLWNHFENFSTEKSLSWIILPLVC